MAIRFYTNVTVLPTTISSMISHVGWDSLRPTRRYLMHAVQSSLRPVVEQLSSAYGHCKVCGGQKMFRSDVADVRTIDDSGVASSSDCRTVRVNGERHV